MINFVLGMVFACSQVAVGQQPANPATAQPISQQAKAQQRSGAILWEDPGNIASRDLRYGIGGEKDAPQGTVSFVAERKGGNSPKFDVRDEQGRHWRAKVGVEARSETAATRILWAVGYFTDEDYFVPELTVQQMPALARGAQFQKGDTVQNVRMELRVDGRKNEGNWKWKKNPFTGTREFNGLRVMMALLNNWDLKDENNSVYRDKQDGRELYVVSDLGASFGRSGRSYTSNMSKDDPEAYKSSKFITKKTAEYVDFNLAQHPPFLYVFNIVKPWRYWQFVGLRWIGKKVPRADAKWIGSLLAQLTDAQLANAFRASGYDEKETELLTASVRKRINELNAL